VRSIRGLGIVRCKLTESGDPFSFLYSIFFFNQLFLLSPFVLYKIQGLESEREQQGHLIHCQLCVAKGELQMASDSFKIVLDEDGNKLWHHFSYAKMI